MAEREDAFLSVTLYLTLILVCNVLASIGQSVASAESSHHRGGAAAQAVHVIHKCIWPGILEKNNKRKHNPEEGSF